MPRKSEHTEYTVKSVSSAFEILEMLTDHQEGYSIAHFASHFGFSRNKTFRLLSTLCKAGLVERDPDSYIYRLGANSVALGQKFLMNSNLVSYTHPIIEQLARKHGEAVYMSVIRENDVLFLDMVDSDQPVKAEPILGKRFPFFTNAAGKVMKAIESRDILARLFNRRGPKKPGSPDFKQLAQELEEIRAKGVAVDSNGLGDGIISVAVAVKDYTGKVVCAITLIGPSFRIFTERLENEIIPSLLAGAEELSQKFGYTRAYA